MADNDDDLFFGAECVTEPGDLTAAATLANVADVQL